MNNFASIIFVQRFRKVTYYSLSINEDVSLFEQFVNKHTVENKEKLNHIMAWIKVIGDNIGAYDQYFRNEAETADARALPPKGKNRKPTYVEVDERTNNRHNQANTLRLYCMKANESVVFLFNGDIKTADKAQDCNNVKSHFRMANTLTRLLNQALAARDIQWNEAFKDIVIDDDFLLEWD